MVVLDLAMESFEVDLVRRVVGDHAHELTGGEACYFRGGYGVIELRRAANGGVAAVDGHALFNLVDLAKSFGKLFRRITGDLAANDIADDVHNDLGLFPSIIFFELTVILDR